MLWHAPSCRYKEYISCGKGRDMGFDSINGYNYKVAGGGGEWAISRESYRMGVHLDYARLMAFYQSAVRVRKGKQHTALGRCREAAQCRGRPVRCGGGDAGVGDGNGRGRGPCCCLPGWGAVLPERGHAPKPALLAGTAGIPFWWTCCCEGL